MKKAFTQNELEENAVIQDFRITASNGKSYQTKLYSRQRVAHYEDKLDMVHHHFSHVRKMVAISSAIQRNLRE